MKLDLGEKCDLLLEPNANDNDQENIDDEELETILRQSDLQRQEKIQRQA